MKTWKLIAAAIGLVMGGFAAGYYVGTHYEVSFDVDRDEEPEEEEQHVYPDIPPTQAYLHCAPERKPSLEEAYEDLISPYALPDPHIEVIPAVEAEEHIYEVEYVTYFWHQRVGYVDGSDEIWNQSETEDFVGTPEVWGITEEPEDEAIIYVKNTELDTIYELTIKMDNPVEV